MKYNFNKIIKRSGTNCFKWDLAPAIFKNGDVLPMWVADMDFKSPPEVIAALKSRCAHGIYGYGARPDSYYHSFINWAKKRYGFNINKEEIIFSPGIVPALSLCVAAFTVAGDGVIIQPPVYPPFAGVVKDHGRKVLENNLKLIDGRYEIDFADLEVKAKSGAKMMFLCAPHNPAGRVWSQSELERVIDICLKYNILLVSDEIHADIVYSGSRHICPASLSKKVSGNIITLMSPSKTFNITGLSISSAVIADKKLREAFNSQIERLHIGLTNIFGITAFEAAYNFGGPWLESLLVYLESNRDYAVDYITGKIPSAAVIKPEATFLMWLDFRKLKMKQDKLNEFIINKARLGLNDGVSFGAAGAGFMRLNFACPRGILAEGLKRLETAVNNINK
jgi:cystathionine beta-lyase